MEFVGGEVGCGFVGAQRDRAMREVAQREPGTPQVRDSPYVLATADITGLGVGPLYQRAGPKKSRSF